ncbi:MAG: peptidoglycan DD-metalloendopeptidase family protein, partial [Bacteroidales bacterium]|nr:peptidoglycan DD-metalloendopeptidase family protein [Bacteroidales bacterium]
MRKYKRYYAIVLSLFLLIGIIFPVWADELDEKQQKLQDVSRQINQQKTRLDQTKKKEKTIMGQLQSLEQNINKTEKEITALEQRVVFLENNIIQTENDIKKLEEELALQSENLGERLVFIYERGNVSYLEVLLAATDVQDFLTRYDMLNLIVEQDVELIESINQQKVDLDMKKSSLLVDKQELESAQKNQESKKDQLDSQRGEKTGILDSVRQEAKQFQKALEELEKASNELETMIRKLQSGSSGVQQGTGTYTWPAPGCMKVTSPYGMRYHPILKTRKLHTGIDIGASQGKNIVAADSGTVIYAGWMGGYGQVTVIDHGLVNGKGMSTLYAH